MRDALISVLRTLTIPVLGSAFKTALKGSANVVGISVAPEPTLVLSGMSVPLWASVSDNFGHMICE